MRPLRPRRTAHRIDDDTRTDAAVRFVGHDRARVRAVAAVVFGLAAGVGLPRLAAGQVPPGIPTQASPGIPAQAAPPNTPAQASPDAGPDATSESASNTAKDGNAGNPGAGVSFGADQVRLDTASQALDVSGHVRVDQTPFHLSSDALSLKRVPIGLELAGQGKVAFCPCLGTPLAVRFSGATVAPPYDLILKQPVLEVFGVPVAWAPAFWLRSPARAGLLPPDLAWRGSDGFFAGGGVHLPWQTGDATQGLDLRAGGYTEGGFAIRSDLVTAATRTSLGWDRLRGEDGVSLDAYGAYEAATGPSAAWRIDALRGGRAVRAVTDVEPAARPFDRAQAEARWGAAGWTFASRIEAVAFRGGDAGDLGASGPVFVARRSDALGDSGTYDATVEGGQLASAVHGATNFARAEGRLQWVARVGPLAGLIATHGIGQVADNVETSSTGAVDSGSLEMRAKIGMPLVRAFPGPASSGPDFADASLSDPWVHTTEPYAELAAVATRVGDLGVLPGGRGMTTPSGGAWVAALGWANAVGTTAVAGARTSAELEATAGGVGEIAPPGESQDAGGTTPGGRVRGALLARAVVDSPWTSLRTEVARVVAAEGASGGALLARLRLGARTGLRFAAHVAERDGVNPILARALVDPMIEPASGFLVTSGWTGGAEVGIPLGSRITARAVGDADWSARELVAIGGALEFHDPCGCVIVRANGSERIGRNGVDLWISVDLPAATR